MRAWAIPKPVPSKPTFMAPSKVRKGPVTRLTGIMAEVSDNHVGPGDQLVAPEPGQVVERLQA
jgi:hypothetical protein